jgi:hypothetical protein
MSRRCRSRGCVVLALVGLGGGLTHSVCAWDHGDGRYGSFVLATNATIEQLCQVTFLWRRLGSPL